MRFKLYLAVALFFVSTCVGQNLFPKWDLAFGQVAVGSNVESVIIVTSRGGFKYDGTFFFWRGEGQVWNPIVNGQPITGGKLLITVEPGHTKTFRLTGPSLVVGTAILYSEFLRPDNFIEGNLTYFFTDSGKVTDSVGVEPSTEFFITTIPFEDFASIGLALANGNAQYTGTELIPYETAEISLKLYDSEGNPKAQSTEQLLPPLPPLAHRAKFLSEFFPAGTQLGRGKVEIASNVPIYGTALTFIFGQPPQSSSLPLKASTVAYAIEMHSDVGDSLYGVMALWAEGFFVKGYLVIDQVNGMQLENEDIKLTLVNGQIVPAEETEDLYFLELSFYAHGEAFRILDDEVSLVLEVLGGFSFQSEEPVGPWVMTSLIEPEATLAGTFFLTKIE